jgi:tRNA pseudouridine38-40 synthase
MRIALGLEYDGRGFCGWQSQPSGCGAQDALQRAISSVSEENITVHAAGRTDAGVHALSQVVHFDTSAKRPVSAWVRGVNAFLPASLRVLWAQPVDDAFHARFSAEQRSYQYLLVNRPVAPAVLDGKVGWFHLPLDVESMRQAASCLLGEHDFSAFRAAECQAKSPIKRLHRVDVRRFGDNILFDFCAGAFLHHQVRNMVGALVYVGKGNYPPGWMAELLASRNRAQAPPTFAPAGLYLTGVGYDVKWGLPASQRSLNELVLPLG